MKNKITPGLFVLSLVVGLAVQANAASSDTTALPSAAKDGDTAKVKSLLSSVSTISGFDRYDLITAAIEAKCNTEIVKAVLEKKGDAFEPKLEEKYGYL